MPYRDVLGCGIAGNFALHLEQAGESADFKDLVVDDPNGPKGIFPFYLRGFKAQIGTYPLSSAQITLPSYEANVQAEPEVALLCELTYTNNTITSVTPIEAFAYNDCSIRREGAAKISQKKNWGENSKGISSNSLKLDTFSKGGVLESYHIASFLRRDNELHVYGEDVEVSGYSYFNEKLTSWITKQLNEQIDTGPLEPISEYIKECNYPTQLLISIGATRYTPYGESTFLKNNDEVIVVLYKESDFSSDEIIKKVNAKDFKDLITLNQKVS